MRQITFIITLMITIKSWGQHDYIGNCKLKATYICCNSSPNDTAFSFLYYYNDDQTLDRIENYRKNRLSHIEQNVYDLSGILIRRLIVVPYTPAQFCGDKVNEDCLLKMREHSYRYDSLSNMYYIIHGDNEINNSNIDSVFRDDKLTAVLSGSDTLHTYFYDKKDRLIKRLDYSRSSQKATYWSIFEYRKNRMIEYKYYDKSKSRPYTRIESVYNDKKQLIIKTKTNICPKEKKCADQHIVEKYFYSDNDLTMYEIYDNTIFAGDNLYCGNRYTKFYIYDE